MLTTTNQDFVIVNRDGINVIALGDLEKSHIKDAEGNSRMIHSLMSMNYLKVNPSNFLLFACAKADQR